MKLVIRTARIVVLIPFLIIIAWQPAQALPPADFYFLVDTFTDDPAKSACTVAANDCSLRGAISSANSAPGGSTIYITIPTGTYYCMQPGSGEDDNSTGDLDLRNNTITLHGAGNDQTILDGQTLDRMVDNHTATLTIESLKITQGVAPSGHLGGGGIANRGGGSLRLYDVVIQGNSVEGSAAYLDGGGGIANMGNLFMETSTLTENEACRGGGIISAGATTFIRTSTISSNNATTDSGCGDGGGFGMYNGDVQTVLEEVLFEGNQGKRGAGMFYNGQHGRITGSTFQNNGSSSYGGGIFSVGILSVNRSTFSGNSTTWVGGGIFTDGSLTLQNSTLFGNGANDGGGLAIFTSETTTIDHVTFSGNTASDEGAVLFTNGIGTLNLHNTILASTDSGNTCVIGTGNIFNDLGYNLNSDDSCQLDVLDHDQVNINPQLSSLNWNGGPTQTMACLSSSPAIDNADPITSQARDQRNYFRPVDGNANGSAIADIGAYEYVSFPLDLYSWLPIILK